MGGGLDEGNMVAGDVVRGGLGQEIFGHPQGIEPGTLLWKGTDPRPGAEQRSRNLRPNLTTKHLCDLDKSLNLSGLLYQVGKVLLALRNCQGVIKLELGRGQALEGPSCWAPGRLYQQDSALD